MAISGSNRTSEVKLWKLCPFWQSNHTSSSSSSTQHLHYNHPSTNSKPTVSSVARSLLPAKRRLRLDPPTHLYFPWYGTWVPHRSYGRLMWRLCAPLCLELAFGMALPNSYIILKFCREFMAKFRKKINNRNGEDLI